MPGEISESQIEIRPVETADERSAVFALRMLVFVEEQQVPVEEELDAYDITATHFLVRMKDRGAADDGMIVATARLVDKGNGLGKVGRVAVLEEYRGRGIGAAIMRTVHDHASECGFTQLLLEAQCYAIPFYEKLGYTAEGDVFLDANITHRNMRRLLGRHNGKDTLTHSLHRNPDYGVD